jgi:hypothetical protein
MRYIYIPVSQLVVAGGATMKIPRPCYGLQLVVDSAYSIPALAVAFPLIAGDVAAAAVGTYYLPLTAFGILPVPSPCLKSMENAVEVAFWLQSAGVGSPTTDAIACIGILEEPNFSDAVVQTRIDAQANFYQWQNNAAHACPVNRPVSFNDKNVPGLTRVPCHGMRSGRIRCMSDAVVLSITGRQLMAGGEPRIPVLPLAAWLPPVPAMVGLGHSVPFTLAGDLTDLRVRAWRYTDATAVTIPAGNIQLTLSPHPLSSIDTELETSYDITAAFAPVTTYYGIYNPGSSKLRQFTVSVWNLGPNDGNTSIYPMTVYGLEDNFDQHVAGVPYLPTLCTAAAPVTILNVNLPSAGQMADCYNVLFLSGLNPAGVRMRMRQAQN